MATPSKDIPTARRAAGAQMTETLDEHHGQGHGWVRSHSFPDPNCCGVVGFSDGTKNIGITPSADCLASVVKLIVDDQHPHTTKLMFVNHFRASCGFSVHGFSVVALACWQRRMGVLWKTCLSTPSTPSFCELGGRAQQGTTMAGALSRAVCSGNRPSAIEPW